MLWWVWGDPGGRGLWEDMAGSSGCAGRGGGHSGRTGVLGHRVICGEACCGHGLVWPLGVGKGGCEGGVACVGGQVLGACIGDGSWR